jgi:hypothetical protein
VHTITVNDVNRLLKELGAAGIAEEMEEWFEREGFEQDVLDLFEQASKRSLVGIFEQMVERGLYDIEVEDGFGFDVTRFLPMLALTYMTSGFTLGWEAHKQLRPHFKKGGDG